MEKEDGTRDVSLQDNLKIYEQNKNNITKDIIEEVKKENLEMSMQPGHDFGLDFEYDVSLKICCFLLV